MQVIQTALNLIFYTLSAFVALCVLLYIPRVAAWFGSVKKQNRITNKFKNKLAIVVPARNEGAVIGGLFKSLEAQSYPPELFDVYVVVKDTKDKGADIARGHGATVLVEPNQTCKGDALNCAFLHILKNGIDRYAGVVIVDADCILDVDFVAEMNNSLAAGRDICQAKRLVKNYLSPDKHANNLVSACNGLIWTLIDDMGNRYKSDKNIVGMSIGTGIMLTAKAVKTLGGWVYCQTLTEDIELEKDCVLRGFTMYFNEHCKIFVEESTSASTTTDRRARWLTGVVDSGRIYNRKLKKVKGKRRDKYFVTALRLPIIFVGTLTVSAIVSLAGACINTLLSDDLGAYISLSRAIMSLATIYMLFFVMTAVNLVVGRQNIKLNFARRIILLFAHPLFYMGYIPIISRALFTQRGRVWHVVEREEGLDTCKGDRDA